LGGVVSFGLIQFGFKLFFELPALIRQIRQRLFIAGVGRDFGLLAEIRHVFFEFEAKLAGKFLLVPLELTARMSPVRVFTVTIDGSLRTMP
jgi:hypothetical protein